MASYLTGKVAIVFGGGAETHRGVAVALAEAGADIVVAGLPADLSAEAALHSISNEIWALGRKSSVVTLKADDSTAFAEAVSQAKVEMGRADLIVRADAVLDA
jgi:meso-butanediol dehydrogenase/(S,S)-butanediol dehydrogenase/diacetyl reductase